MAKKPAYNSKKAPAIGKPSSLVDTRIIYCGDNLDQLQKLPDRKKERLRTGTQDG